MYAKVKRARWVLQAGAAMIAMMPLGAAMAQDSETTDAGLFGQDIVVTATRREERLNTVPVSITALNAGQVEALGAEDVTDIQAITPNFNVQAVVTRPNDPIMVIRGVLKRDGDATLDTAVGVYSDEVFLARGYSVMGQLLDVERIEVLRGPQGTLFGRNTIGGAVQVISTKPKVGGDVEGYLEATAGNYSLVKLGGAINLPITPTLSVRFAGKFQDRKGYTKSYLVDDTGPNGYRDGDPILDVIDTNDAHDWAGRISLGWEPGPDTRVDLSAYRSKTDTNGVLSRGKNGDLGVLSPTYLQSNTPCAPGGCGLAAGYSEYAQHSFYSGLTDVRPDGDSKVSIYIGKIEQQIGDVTAKFIASYADAASQSVLNTDGIVGYNTPLVVNLPGLPAALRGRESAAYSDGKVEQATFEVQFSGSLGDRFNWIGGLYYFEETADDLIYLATSNLVASGAPVNVVDVRAKNDSKSVYGSASYEFTDQLSLRVGGRYTEDSKAFDGRSRTFQPATGIGVCAFNPAITFPTGTAPGSNVDPACRLRNKQDFSNFTWDASIDYKLSDATFLYAKAGTGYRTGGISLNAVSAATAVPFKEDRVMSYEAGIKTDVGRIGHINLTAFYMDYKDVQQNIISSATAALGLDCGGGYAGAPIPLSCNIGDATSKGIELDASLKLGPLSLLGTWGYTRFRYDSPAFRPLFVPKHAASITGSYQTTVAEVPVNAVLSYQYSAGFMDGLPTGGVPNSVAQVDGYSLLNARLNVDVSSNLTASLWARNLTKDKYYGTAVTVTSAVFQVNSGVPGVPRTYGIDLKFNF